MPQAPDQERKRRGKDVPINKTIHQDLALVYSCWEGRVTIDEIIEAQECYKQMATYDPAFQYLVDLRGVTDPEVDFTRFGEIVSTIEAPVSDTARPGDDAVDVHGIVLAPTDLTFGLARQFQAFAELRGGLCITIHRTIDALALKSRRPTQAVYGLLSGGGRDASA